MKNGYEQREVQPLTIKNGSPIMKWVKVVEPQQHNKPEPEHAR